MPRDACHAFAALAHLFVLPLPSLAFPLKTDGRALNGASCWFGAVKVVESERREVPAGMLDAMPATLEPIVCEWKKIPLVLFISRDSHPGGLVTAGDFLP